MSDKSTVILLSSRCEQDIAKSISEISSIPFSLFPQSEHVFCHIFGDNWEIEPNRVVIVVEPNEMNLNFLYDEENGLLTDLDNKKIQWLIVDKEEINVDIISDFFMQNYQSISSESEDEYKTQKELIKEYMK